VTPLESHIEPLTEPWTGLPPRTVRTDVMLANIVVQDRPHLGFRAIHKMATIRFLSGVIWGIPG
jgi:hypothetical protein